MAGASPDLRLYGVNRRRIEMPGLILRETRYFGGRADPLHAHVHPSFCLVVEGGFDERYRSSSVQCSASTLIFFPAGVAHCERFHDAGARCLIVEAPRWDDHDAPRDPLIVGAGPITGVAHQIYRELCACDDLSPLAIDGLLLELLVALTRRQRREMKAVPHRIARAEEIVRAHFRSPMSLTSIAREVGLSPAHLATEFRRVHGCTVGELFRRLRVEYAMERLRETNDSLAEIALAAGFCDQSHFTRVFRRMTGTTPAVVRRIASQS